MTRFATRSLGAVALAAVLVAAGPARSAAAAERPTTPKALSEPRIAAQVEPGTVLIVHDEAATVSVAKGAFNLTLFESLLGSDQEIVGLRRRDPAAALEKGAQRYLLADPARFFSVTSKRAIAADALFTGSGAVVSGDGYLVTNAHVVAPDPDEIHDALLDSSADEVDDDISAVLDDIDGAVFGGTMSSDIEDKLASAYRDFLDRNSDFGKATKTTSILSGAADPTEAKTKGRAAEVVELGEGYPQKDVAVLKVQASDQYTIPLGDDAEAVSGTKVFAVGYPGEATFDSGAAKGTELEPSISSGTVSARRTVEGGYSVIQHNAAIQHGSSGGPMVDESGRIIGLTTAGSDEQGTFYYSVPVSLVKEFLKRKNVAVTSSRATTQYVAALESFDRKHFKKARQQLWALDRTSPGLPFVAARIEATQKKIDAGENVDESSFRLPGGAGGALLVAAFAAGGLLVLLVGLGVILLVRRPKQAAGSEVAAWPAAPTSVGNPWAPGAPTTQPPAPPTWGTPPPPPAGFAPPPPPGGFAPPLPPAGFAPPSPPSDSPSPLER